MKIFKDEEGRATGILCTGKELLQAPTMSIKKFNDTRERILKLLEHSQILTEPQIRGGVKKSKEFVLWCLKELCRETVIMREGAGLKGSPFKYIINSNWYRTGGSCGRPFFTPDRSL